MAILNEFKTIAERENAFDRVEVKSFTELLRCLEAETKGAEVFFRGQASARWKVFSYIQRDWIQKDLNLYFCDIDDFLKSFLAFCRKELALEIIAHCKEPFDVSLLSVLQHYGAPTPFVDFTSNYDVALYFAVNGNKFVGGDQIDNFFSIYVVNPGGVVTASSNDLTNYEDILSGGHNNLQDELRTATDVDVINAINSFDENTLKSLDSIANYSCVYIKETGENFLSISNKRIDLQDGLFLYQGKKSIESLDSIFSGSNVGDVGSETFDELFFPKLKVFDVHKSVLDSAKKYLDEKGVNANKLGLHTNEFGRLAYEKYIGKLAF